MAPSAYHPGEHFDELLDRLAIIGKPAGIDPRDWLQWDRIPGEQGCWVGVWLPGEKIGKPRWSRVDAPNLDLAAKALIVLELTAGDREAEIARLERAA